MAVGTFNAQRLMPFIADEGAQKGTLFERDKMTVDKYWKGSKRLEGIVNN